MRLLQGSCGKGGSGQGIQIRKMPDFQKFDSFEEMKDSHLRYLASLTPEQSLMNLKRLVLISFGYRDESEIPAMPRIINFDRKHFFYH